MSLLNDDNAKMISMITEGKIQAGEANQIEADTVKQTKLDRILFGTVGSSFVDTLKEKRNKKAEGGSLLQDDMAMNDMTMDEPMMEQPVMD